jgi:hypothetical protein
MLACMGGPCLVCPVGSLLAAIAEGRWRRWRRPGVEGGPLARDRHSGTRAYGSIYKGES